MYAVDTFTAVNLLAFNKWSSEIQPAVSFDVTKWIFSICIILSFLNVGYEHIRAQRIMRRGAVAESYLDNLAVRLESVKMGKGKGWRRFLVFAELTKSKKGAEYIALFTYFSFQCRYQAPRSQNIEVTDNNFSLDSSNFLLWPAASCQRPHSLLGIYRQACDRGG